MGQVEAASECQSPRPPLRFGRRHSDEFVIQRALRIIQGCFKR